MEHDETEAELKSRPQLMVSHYEGVQIECVAGDISDQPEFQAVVNAANAQLEPGGGVAGALHAAAGPGLAEECRRLAPIRPGQAVLTRGHHLPNAHVIHCLGPVYGVDQRAEDLLAGCYSKALRLAEQFGIESIAFPAITTGAFGYPFIEATQTAWRTILSTIPSLKHLKRIRMVLASAKSANIACTLLSQLMRQRSAKSPSTDQTKL